VEIAAWAEQLFPRIAPEPWGETCWLAWLKTRSPEHNPPLYWLGHALDAVAEGGGLETLAARLAHAHGEDACEGWTERDERVQDVLSEACAFAWAAAHLGPPRFALQGEAPDVPLLVHVPAHDAYLSPRRLWPVRTMDDLLQQLGQETSEAAALLPAAAGRLVYVDVYMHPRMYAQDVGYRTELTEPLRAALKHFAAEHRLGYVLTRPFQWGNAIEAAY
jgi:hypothetical protein